MYTILAPAGAALPLLNCTILRDVGMNLQAGAVCQALHQRSWGQGGCGGRCSAPSKVLVCQDLGVLRVRRK